jgi:hypothetical protein
MSDFGINFLIIVVGVLLTLGLDRGVHGRWKTPLPDRFLNLLTLVFFLVMFAAVVTLLCS